MRMVIALLLILPLFGAVRAQADKETPRQSFERFVEAVLSDTLTAEERRAKFERYFDFDQWLAQREGEPTAEGVDRMKADWFELLESDEFRDSYRERDVRVIEEPKPDPAAARAELVIAMKGETGDEKFRVMMKLSVDGTWWRWYLIPEIEEAAVATTPAERLKQIADALVALDAQRGHLDQLEQELRRELAKLRAEEAETDTGSSPVAVVTAAWKAIERGDVQALLDCHATARVAQSNREAVQASMIATRERLMSWEVRQATIDEDDNTRANVPVKLTLRRTGSVDERTISVRVVRFGAEWKIDEAP